MGAARPFRQAGEMWWNKDSNWQNGAVGPAGAGPRQPRQRAVVPSGVWPAFRCLITSARSAISCSRSRWRSSSRRIHSSRLGKRRRPRRWCLCPHMCSPPFLVALEKRPDRPLRAAQRLGPRVEDAAALVGELVGALRGAGQLVAPLGGDEALLLEGAQEAVEIADVHAALRPQLREPLEQLVAVQRPLAQEQQQRRLDEALDPGLDVPVARPQEPAAARARVVSSGHGAEYR